MPTAILRYAAVLAAAVLLVGCAALPANVARVHSRAWAHSEETTLGKSAFGRLGASTTDSGFLILDSGMDALAARAALAEAAEQTLDLQYFIVRNSATTQLLLLRLLRAADRGVRVRLLVDDLSAAGEALHLDGLTAHANVEVRVFNPFTTRGTFGLPQLFEYLASGERLDRRMHNKLWIADNAAAVAGGRNLGDEYFGADPAMNFADLDVFMVGPVVRELSQSFDAYWNNASSVPVESFASETPSASQVSQLRAMLEKSAERFRDTSYAQALRDGSFGQQLRRFELPLIAAPAEVRYDDPDKPVVAGEQVASRAVTAFIHPYVESAQHEVLLISPYFIPSERSADALTALAKRGVQVRLLTNSLASTDVPAAHAAYSRYRERLLAGGVQIHEMRPLPSTYGARSRFGSTGASLHAKVVVVDRHLAVIGSMNLDPRSRRHNTEVALFIDSAEIGAQLAGLFEEGARPSHAYRVDLADPDRVESGLAWITEEEGTSVRHTNEPASFWRRLSADLLSILAPEDML